MSLRIVCVCGDPGPAEAVAPVAAALAREHSIEVHAWVSEIAAAAFTRRNIAIESRPDAAQQSAALDRLRPELVLTGSSWAEQSELLTIAAATARGIPSLTVLDFWSHYRERFTTTDGAVVFPTVIAVPDEEARRGVLAAGCPAERVVVTGGPQFDRLAALREDGRSRETLRRELGLPLDRLLIVFVSQPIAALVGRSYGFTETEVLEVVSGALRSIAEKTGRALTLAIKRHPKEALTRSGGSLDPPVPMGRSGGSLDPPVGSSAKSDALDSVELPAALDPLTCVRAADLVVGMNSVLLYEASLLGQIVVSVQPGLTLPDPLISNKTELTLPVYDRQVVPGVLRRALLDEDFRAEHALRLRAHLPVAGAARRVAALARSLMTQRS